MSYPKDKDIQINKESIEELRECIHLELKNFNDQINILNKKNNLFEDKLNNIDQVNLEAKKNIHIIDIKKRLNECETKLKQKSEKKDKIFIRLNRLENTINFQI